MGQLRDLNVYGLKNFGFLSHEKGSRLIRIVILQYDMYVAILKEWPKTLTWL